MGEDRTDDLSYEDYVAEDYAGGTDSGALDEEPSGGHDSYGKESLYSAEDSKELTDVDYNPYDDSRAFTESGSGTDAYADQFGHHDDGDSEEGMEQDVDQGMYSSQVGVQGTATENFTDDWEDDEEDNFDGGEDEDENDDDEGGLKGKKKPGDKQGQEQDDEDPNDVKKFQTTKKGKKQHARIPWEPGDKIDLKLLSQVWEKITWIKEVQPLVNAANESMRSLLLTMPDSLILQYVKAHDQFRQWQGASRSDLIGTILDMAKSIGTRMVYTTVSTVGAFFSQTWTDPFLIATMPATIDMVLANPIMQGVLETIFQKAVPILEGMNVHEGENGKAVKHVNINY